MPDIFDEVYDSVPIGGSLAANAPDAFDEVYAQVGSPVDAIAGQLSKGAAFGWADEFTGAESGLRNSIASIFGGGNGKSFSQNYRAGTDKARTQDAAFEAANPKTAMGLQFAGNLLPVIASGGAGALLESGAAVAPQFTGSDLLRRVLGDLTGAGITKAPSLLRLSEMGLIGGGLTGAGESIEGDRLKGGMVGAGVGAIAAPVVGKALEGATNVAGDFLANHGINTTKIFDGSFGSQRGSISDAPASTGYTPEELILAKQLKNTPLDKILAGSDELSQALDQGVPLFLPEALNSPKVDRNARYIANYEPSIEFAQTAINERALGAPDRALNLFDTISPERNSFVGAQKLTDAAGGIIDSAIKERSAQTAPLFAEALKNEAPINSEGLIDLYLNDKPLQDAVRSVTQYSANKGVPEDSLGVLHQAKGILDDKYQAAIAKGNNNEARLLATTRANLQTELEIASPLYATANRQYAALSPEIEELQKSFLGKLQSISNDKIQNVGQIFNLPAEQIGGLRQAFVDNNLLPEWEAGIRAHIQNVVEGSKDGRNFTDNIIGSTAQRNKLKAALGSKYDIVGSGLALEDRMFQGKNKYHAGSSTVGNAEEGKQYERNLGFVDKLRKKDWVGAATHMFEDGYGEETAKELAKIYFDPKRGSESIQKIIPLLEQYAKTRTLSNALSKGAAIGVNHVPSALVISGSPNRTVVERDNMMNSILDAAVKSKLGSEAADSSQTGSRTSLLIPEPISVGQQENRQVIESLLNRTSGQKPNQSLLFKTLGLKPEGENMARSPEFDAKVEDIASNLDVNPEHLFKAMAFETGGTFDPAVKNKAGSGATGLIQFMGSTAKELTGADTKQAALKILGDMSATEQLDYVEKYLKPFKGKLNSVDDVYMAILYPKAVGKDSEYALFKEGTTAYWQNRGLDIDKDGVITKAEATNKVRNYQV